MTAEPHSADHVGVEQRTAHARPESGLDVESVSEEFGEEWQPFQRALQEVAVDIQLALFLDDFL